ncbi:uncharacterized protein LOC125046132 isoform X4 [Penaeus chinensis]|uniref:uncharacterized protein LOC125046132 isoform X4 n=1 Tax=Penaeus chinensis TaxID=139456 RepID=UPI001FB57B95|nr:uncharacterized protein LOC125046132 isoform X4 [Penaeus chinensis]
MLPCCLTHATRFSLSSSVERLPTSRGKDSVLKGNTMNWSQEKNIEFIEEYRKLSVLWDVRLQEYKNNQAKLDALRGLAEKYNCDVEMLKKKIKNLRTAFRREHKRLTQKKSGSSPIKTGKWFAYELLLFLLDVDTPRPGYSSQAEPQTEQSPCIEDEPGGDDPTETLGTSSTLNAEAPEASQEAEKGDSNDDGKEASNKRRGQSWKRKTVDDERAEEAYQILKDSVKRDDCSIYAEHVACEIRKLDPKAQAIVKHLINNILFEAAMGKYDSGDRSHQFGLPPAHLFHTSASSSHHNPIASDSSASTPRHSFYSDSSTPDYDHGASTSISKSPSIFAQLGNQSHQESVVTPASQGFVAQLDNEYHPHFVQTDKEPEQHHNETDVDGSLKSQQPPGIKGKPSTEKYSIEEFQRQLKRLKKEKNILLKKNRLWAKEIREARKQMSDLRYHNELMAEERDKARKERDALQLEKRHLLKALDEERKEKEALVARKKQKGAELQETVTESSGIPDCPLMETPTVNVINVKNEDDMSHTEDHKVEMKDVESEDTDIEPKMEEEITIKEEEMECNDPLLTFPCKFCETVYATKCDLENHIKEEHERGDLLSCCSCEKMFHKDIELKLHEVVQHQAKLCKKEMPAKRAFRDAWLEDSNFKGWLKKVDGNHQKAFCEACGYHLSAEISAIKRHKTSRIHCTNMIPFYASLSSSTNTSAVSKYDMTTRAEVKFFSYFEEHKISLNSFEHFKNILKDAVPDSKIIQSMALKNIKQRKPKNL